MGRIINNQYEIVEQIGAGGQSQVFRAKQLSLNRSVALKQIDKETTRVGFLAEVNILKDLNHANLPKIFDIFEDEKYCYIVEEFVDGEDLEKYIKRVPNIPEASLIEWFKSLCNVLKYLHNRDNPIVFGDMKPKNVMLQKDGVIKLIDFGIAREYVPQDGSETVLGYSPGYAAPEILKGGVECDIRSDIYSLGVTMYRLAANRKPDPDNPVFPSLRKVAPNRSVGLETIIDKCIRINPNERYQSADEILYDLENIVQFDINYQKYLKKKAFRRTLVMGLYALAIALVVGGFLLNKKEINDRYYALIEQSRGANLSLDNRIAILDEAIELIPGNIDAHLAKAEAYYASKNYGKTVETLKDVLENTKKSDEQFQIYSLLGSSYYEMQNYEKGAETYKLLMDSYTPTEEICLNYATCLIQLGRDSEAERVISQISAEGSGAKKTFIQGEIAYIGKDYRTAEQKFLEVINSKEDDDLTYRSYMNLVSLYRYGFQQREIITSNVDDPNSKSISVIATIMNTYDLSNNPVLWEEKGLAYYNRAVFEKHNDATDLGEAITCFRNVLNLGMQSEHIYNNILTCQEYLKDYGNAQKTIDEMKQLYPESSNVYVQSSRLCILIESTKPNSSRNYRQAYQDYLTAKDKLKSGESDVQIKQLESLIDQLKAGGWIN